MNDDIKTSMFIVSVSVYLPDSVLVCEVRSLLVMINALKTCMFTIKLACFSKNRDASSLSLGSMLCLLYMSSLTAFTLILTVQLEI